MYVAAFSLYHPNRENASGRQGYARVCGVFARSFCSVGSQFLEKSEIIIAFSALR
jgi:hypothetical protein